MWTYPAVVFLSAALLFLVQPIVAKFILPWYGGTPSVWTACMLFFQSVLVAGYAYSHGLSRLRARRQVAVHLALLAGSVVVLGVQCMGWGGPLLPGANWIPAAGSDPVLRILATLLVSVGVGFFALSTTSSLVQAWLGALSSGRSPYWLYAVSNTGSLLGLLAYPFVIEPALSIGGQSRLWAIGYGLFAASCAGAAIRFGRGSRGDAAAPARASADEGDGNPGSAGRPRVAKVALWVALPLCASVMLLATTAHINEEIAAVPLLWILPLVLYLMSFILCFGRRSYYSRRLMFTAWLVAVGCLLLAAVKGVGRVPIGSLVAVHALSLFTSCMICHGELSERRPPLSGLTLFYFCLSVGGALGGVLAGVVAPRVFSDLWEFYLGHYAVAVIVLAAVLRSWPAEVAGAWRWLPVSVVLTVVSLLFAWSISPGRVESRRGFYGIVRVVEERYGGVSNRVAMMHGRTVQGFQIVDPVLRRKPTSYFTESAGVGLAFQNHPKRSASGGEASLRVGVVGLGVGTVAAYGRAGDRFRFYEINPDVIELAHGPHARFTYLADSPAAIEVVPGDARLSLAAERGSPYDLLVLDAYSGDTPPVHLLTLEAFRLYRSRLANGGVLAVNVSNRYLRLAPLIFGFAKELGLRAVKVDSLRVFPTGYSASWVLMSADGSFFEAEAIRKAGRPPPAAPGGRRMRLWTDDYSNLLQLLR
jgi:hypothetical protein